LITAHYVNSLVNKPNQWALKEDQLAFALLEGHHTRANITSIISNVLNEYVISQKVSIFSIHPVQMLTACSRDGSPPTMRPTMTWPSKH
jgi:hypothetical protein